MHSIIHFHAEKQCVFEIRYWGNDSAKKALCNATLAKGTQVKYPALPTNVTVLIFSETHKIRSPEAMTRLMNLLIPDSWKNMRRAWSVLDRHDCYQKKSYASQVERSYASDSSLYLENMAEERSSRLSRSSDSQIDISSKRHRTLNVSSFPLSFPLRRKILTVLLPKIDCTAREVTQNITRWRCWIIRLHKGCTQDTQKNTLATCVYKEHHQWLSRKGEVSPVNITSDCHQFQVTIRVTIRVTITSDYQGDYHQWISAKGRTTLPWFPTDQSRRCWGQRPNDY